MDYGHSTGSPSTPPVAPSRPLWRDAQAILLAAALAALTFGCAGADATAAASDKGSCGISVPDGLTERAGRGWFVQSQDCSAGDGSAARPFNRLGDALSAAKPGDTIVLGDVRISDEVRLPAGVNLVAARTGMAKLIDGGQLTIVGDGRTTVRGIIIDGASGVGFSASAGRIWLEDVIIRGTRATADQGGHGVSVTDAAQLTLIRAQILDNQGVGVLAKRTSKVSIIEPIYLPTARNLAGKFGIIEPIYLPTSQISGNGVGGIAIIEPIYSPAGAPNLHLEGTRVSANGGFGVGLWGASARIINSAIDRTKVGAKGPWADGIMLAAGRKGGEAVAVQIDARSVITDNGRTGVAMLARASLQVAGDVSKNKLCGIWAGQASLVSITGDAMFSGNSLVGVAVAEGADLRFDGGTVRGTVAQKLSGGGEDSEAGDGIGVFDGARATIVNARLQNNARAGLILDQPKQLADGSPDVIVSGSVVSGGKYAVVVNGSPSLSFAADNTYQSAADADANDAGRNGDPGNGAQAGSGGGNGGQGAAEQTPPQDKTNAAMPVKKQICADAASCAPSF